MCYLEIIVLFVIPDESFVVIQNIGNQIFRILIRTHGFDCGSVFPGLEFKKRDMEENSYGGCLDSGLADWSNSALPRCHFGVEWCSWGI